MSVSVHLVVLLYLSTLSHSWTPFRAAFEALRRWGKMALTNGLSLTEGIAIDVA